MGISRPFQAIWLVGAIVFLVAVYHTTQAGIPREWVSTTTAPAVHVPDDYEIARLNGRPSLADHIQLSNKIWAKTVRQRHQMLKDWPETENMPL